jgi:dTDP-4-dehydrorhamnose reductase
MKKKVIVLGAGGMAGHVITLQLRNESTSFNVIAISRNTNRLIPEIILDVTNFTELKKIIAEHKPDAIINCIGVLNKNAEDHPANAVLLNSYLPHFLEELTSGTQTKIIHISTDCVFSGKKGGYLENEHKDGEGYYAQTKALGEINNSKDLTIRTSIIGPELNEGGIGLFHWFSKQQGKINGYTNAFWTGVTTTQLALEVVKAITNDVTGLYHLVNEEKISKYSLLQLFSKIFENNTITEIIPESSYKSDKSLINTRKDFLFDIPSYETMVKEMRDWIVAHRSYYPHYEPVL